MKGDSGPVERFDIAALAAMVRDHDKRMAMTDGNGTDPHGGRLGRLEEDAVWNRRMLITTLLSSLGSLFLLLLKYVKP